MATLEVKNEHNAALVIQPDNPDAAAVDIPPGKTADLELGVLNSRSFRQFFAEGKLSFVANPSPSSAQVALGRVVMPVLLSDLAGRVLKVHWHASSAKASLAADRDAYNKALTQTKARLTTAKGESKMAGYLSAALDTYLNTHAEQAAVDALQQDIDALLTQKPDTITDLAAWLADVEANKSDLEQAEAVLAARQAVHDTRYQLLIDRIKTAATDMSAANKDEVGDPITWPNPSP